MNCVHNTILILWGVLDLLNFNCFDRLGVNTCNRNRCQCNVNISTNAIGI